MATPFQQGAARTPAWQTVAGLCALIFVFIGAGWPFMKRLGIEVDEALIGNGIYEHGAAWYSWHVLGRDIPVMLLTYVGALKTWIYNPLFAVVRPGATSLRLPMLLVGALTIVLFFVLLDRVAGRRPAWLGAALLATDPSFVVTEAIDFGFVALQCAFKLGAMLLLLSFHRDRSRPKLAGAFFLLGLAMWDKAVFVWILVAIVLAGSVVFRREVLRHMTVSNMLLVCAAFALGALPLIIYNIERPLETFTQNARLTPDNPDIKLIVLKRTLDGSGLFGVVTALDQGPRPGAPHGALQRAAFLASRRSGAPVADWTLWAFIGSVLAVPLIWRTDARRPVMFALLFLAITWLAMFFTTGAGGAVHHVILLWPFHLMAISIVLSRLAGWLGRSGVVALAAAGAVLCISNLAVVNQYYVALIQNGTGVRWTDAFAPLTEELRNLRSPAIFVADWGILETLNLVSMGELPVTDASFALRPEDQPKNQERLAVMLETPAIWVTHSPAAEQWPGVRQSLMRFANERGYTGQVLDIVHDRNGRPIFEIFRFRHTG